MSEIKAKPLTWTAETCHGFTVHIGSGLGFAYKAAAKVYNPGWIVTLGEEVIFDGDEDTFEEDAKAAAQSDFDARIRSAIERAEPVAWRWCWKTTGSELEQRFADPDLYEWTYRNTCPTGSATEKMIIEPLYSTPPVEPVKGEVVPQTLDEPSRSQGAAMTRTASTSAQALAMELGITDTAKKAKAYDLILALLTLERERDKWQPIDDAPKDGTEILLYREDCGVILGRWISPAEFISDGDIAENFTEDEWHEPDWFGADFVSGFRISNDGTPTHWQPLPSPPGANE